MQLCVASFSFIMENDRNPLSEISTNLPNSRGAQILSRSKRRQEEAAKHEQCRRFVNSIPRPSSSSATGSGSVSAPGPGTSSSPPKKSRRAEIEQSRAENNEADKRSQSSVSVTTNVTINNTPGGNNNQQSLQIVNVMWNTNNDNDNEEVPEDTLNDNEEESEDTVPGNEVDQHQETPAAIETGTENRRRAPGPGPGPIARRRIARHENLNSVLYSDKPGTIKRNFLNGYCNIKCKCAELQKKAGKQPNYLLLVQNDLHDASCRTPAAHAGKTLVWGEGPLMEKYLDEGVKFHQDSSFVCRTIFNMEQDPGAANRAAMQQMQREQQRNTAPLPTQPPYWPPFWPPPSYFPQYPPQMPGVGLSAPSARPPTPMMPGVGPPTPMMPGAGPSTPLMPGAGLASGSAAASTSAATAGPTSAAAAGPTSAAGAGPSSAAGAGPSSASQLVETGAAPQTAPVAPGLGWARRHAAQPSTEDYDERYNVGATAKVCRYI